MVWKLLSVSKCMNCDADFTKEVSAVKASAAF